ncbi:MAG: esterase-like activity of phytase family protein [Streptosporangiales bacterium]|nr:esterase-like activity of phytase family protein [Streptosporangiales bacterium]
MPRRLTRAVVAFTATTALLLTATPSGATAEPRHVSGYGPWHARLLGEHVVGKDVVVDGTRVGELSSIDYDRRTGAYYLIADDTELAPAHFYTVRMRVSGNGVSGVRFARSTWILRTDGTVFPALSGDGTELADPESMRVDPRTRTLYWGSEGKREVAADGSAELVDPWVRQMTVGGRNLRQLATPENMRMTATEAGPRRNLVFEGLTLTADGRQVVASAEGARYEDGPIAMTGHGAVNRLTWWDRRSGRAVRQLAYPLDAIPVAPEPPSAAADNGISEILAVDRWRYLVVERSFASGAGNSIRVYEVDTRGATNVLRRTSLSSGDYAPVRKRLVLDLGAVGLEHVDNIEGVTWGPRLPTGEHSLVFVSDDNFNDVQVTQLVTVAVRPSR